VVSAVLIDVEAVRALVAAVPDPEMPFVTLGDLGILRSVEVDDGRLVVTVTPTYSGCPAMREILGDLTQRLASTGWGDAEIRVAMSPAWTTDWITEAGRQKLAAAGIAPPSGRAQVRPVGPVPLTLGVARASVACPRCGSTDTVERSRFSATACKALYFCRSCVEPFEHLKDF
jgi:ring-1,2-phenylacetyl-CoA epoxidase subunit PaaD